MIVSELGNLMADILLSPWRMSTVKSAPEACSALSSTGAGLAGRGLEDFGDREQATEAAAACHGRVGPWKSSFSYDLHRPVCSSTACTQIC
jgi:hypothetical protein